jgi:2-polyprenyl-3-methyl-5-hydroxy-6-metoxy-1,4-benzoquinol methylase
MCDHRFSRGKPAEETEFIVARRIELLYRSNDFVRSDVDLLDIGCGNGATLLRLAGSYRHCHGIDISEESGARFVAEAAQRELTTCSFSVEDIESLEPAGRAFDRIICFEVLEHVQDDLRAAMTINELLRPGGMAAITVPNRWWIFETHGANLPYLPWNRVPLFSWLPTRMHERFARARVYTKKRILQLLRSAGFEITSIFHITAPMDRISWAPLRSILRSTLFSSHSTSIPFFSTSIMVFVSKNSCSAKLLSR